MSFLYPTFLWALTALSIPVIVHLFNFRKTQRVYFSNTRFLKQVKEVTTSKRRLKHYLILASRLLFLFFLVMVFAQPVIPAREQLDARRQVVVYLDNSLSMSAQLEDRTRALDAAIGYVQHIADLFSPDTRYKLVTNDFSPFSNTFKTKTEIADLLTQIRLSPVSRTAPEIVSRIRLDGRLRDQEVFWISDFQKSTFGQLVPDQPDSTFRWRLVPLSPAVSDNVFIDTVYLGNPFAVGQEKNSLHVRVRNDGRKAVEQLNLKLMVNDIQAATASVSIVPGGMQETSFDLTTGITGLNRAQIRFNDFPVSFDNDFFVALNFTDKIRVLEIKASSQETAIGRVFGNNEVFAYKGYPVGNFNYSLLDQADLVVVNGIDRIDASLSLAVQQYLNDFGTLLFIPGPGPDADSYSRLLGVSVSSANVTPKRELDAPDFNDPFFENVFEERSATIAMPSAVRLLNWGADRSAILKFKDGTPFLSLFQQTGKLYLMAAPLDESHTDLFRNALFVPVMYRIASSARREFVKPYYTLRENFVSLKVDTLMGEEPLRLVGEQEVIPSQRTIGDRVLLDIPKFSMTQGFYHAMINRDTIDLLAFNLSKEESMMDRYAPEEVENLFGSMGDVSVFEAGTAETFSNEIKDRYLGEALWKYALVLALFFLLVEILLIRFMK